MAASYTASTLIANVRRRFYAPNAGGPSDADILAFMNAETWDYIVTMLLQCAEEYLVAVSDITTVSGTSSYDVPSRSVGVKIRDVQVPFNDTYVSIPRIQPEEAPGYTSASSNGYASAYYVQMNQIVLVPEPQSAYTLRVKYYRRPSQLVTSGYAAVTVASGTTITVVSTSGLTSTSGKYDFIGSNPPFQPVLDSKSGTIASGTTLTFASDVVSEVTVGDYVAIEGDSPVPEIPVETIPLLEQRTAARILQAMRDAGASDAFRECDATEKRVRELLAPRTAGRPQKYVGVNGPGWRTASWWGWRGAP